jgi:hypothetical protein
MLAWRPERTAVAETDRSDVIAHSLLKVKNLPPTCLFSIFWIFSARSPRSKTFELKDLSQSCKKNEVCIGQLMLAREDSARAACVASHAGIRGKIRYGSGGRSHPSFGTSGRRTSRRKDRGLRDDHSSGRCSSPSTGGACGGTRRPTHNRDSVRSLPTFLANSPSPLLFLWRQNRRR